MYGGALGPTPDLGALRGLNNLILHSKLMSWVLFFFLAFLMEKLERANHVPKDTRLHLQATRLHSPRSYHHHIPPGLGGRSDLCHNVTNGESREEQRLSRDKAGLNSLF